MQTRTSITRKRLIALVALSTLAVASCGTASHDAETTTSTTISVANPSGINLPGNPAADHDDNSPEGDAGGSGATLNNGEATEYGNGAGLTADPADLQLVDAAYDTNSTTEVAETIADLGLSIDYPGAEFWGSVSLLGQFVTTEISGCWTDHSNLNTVLELWEVDGLIIGQISSLADAGSNAPIFHDTGNRCGTSDQGPMVTSRDSIEILALGYVDETDGGLYLMLEGSDETAWTLASGGEIGTDSFLAMFLPILNSGIEVGGVGGMFVSDQQLAAAASLRFSGTQIGDGSTTSGRLAVVVAPNVRPEEVNSEVAESSTNWVFAGASN